MGIKSLSNSSGIVNFQKHQSLLAGIELNKFHHLETVRLGSSAASVEFTNLGQYADYQHLQIRIVGRESGAYFSAAVFVQLNAVTSASYAWHRLQGNGSSVTSGNAVSQTSMRLAVLRGNSGAANAFTTTVIDILDPFDTNKNTTIRSLSGMDYQAAGDSIVLSSGLFNNTASITEIKLFTNGVGFDTGSRFSLYGLKVRA